MVNGCVLLSEHSLGFEPLIPGEHFVSVSYDSLDVALEALLEDDDRLGKIRLAAYELLRGEFPMSASIHVLAETVDEVASRPVPAVRARPYPVLPRPKPPQVPPPEYERILGSRTEVDVLRMATKQLLLEQREMSKVLRDMQSKISGEPRGEDVVEQIGQLGTASPRVSVVLTVYNYASLVGVAIDSVAASDFNDYELVIVDDASSDGSGDAIRTAPRTRALGSGDADLPRPERGPRSCAQSGREGRGRRAAVRVGRRQRHLSARPWPARAGDGRHPDRRLRIRDHRAVRD